MREKTRTPYGARLVEARTMAGLTQPQLAKLVGMAQGTLGEAETTAQGSKFTAQIARVLGVRAEWLASGNGPMREGNPLLFSDELLAAINSLDHQSITRLENVMRAHLGMLPISRDEIDDRQTQQQTETPMKGKTVPPVGKNSGFLDRLKVGGKGAVGESGGIQKSRSGRNPKGAA